MTRTVISLAVVLLLSWPSQAAGAQRRESDREHEGLRGPVQIVREESARLTNESGGWVEGARRPSRLLRFDPEGNVTEREAYDYRGNLSDKFVYRRDAAGNQIARVLSPIYAYNPPPAAAPPPPAGQGAAGGASQSQTSAIVELPDGARAHSYTMIYRYRYDEQGRRIEQALFNERGEPSTTSRYTYDERGNRTEDQLYARDGSLNWRAVYSYDAQGNRVEATFFRGSGAVLSRHSYTYEFDAHGNWIKRVSSRWVTRDGNSLFEPSEVTHRTITYYNEPSGSPETARAVPAAPNRGEASPPEGGVVVGLDAPPLSSARSVCPAQPPAEVSGGVLNGRATHKPAPPYPTVARAAGAAGVVVVSIVFDEAGQVIWACATDGHPLLRAAAQEAASQARFSPVRVSERPVKVSGVITYNFVLQ